MLQESFQTITELTNEVAKALGITELTQTAYVDLFELVAKAYNAGYVDGREYEKFSK